MLSLRPAPRSPQRFAGSPSNSNAFGNAVMSGPRQSRKRSANGTVRGHGFAANHPAPVMEDKRCRSHGVRETKCTPSRASSEKPSAAPDATSIRNLGVPQRWYWSESM